MDTLPPELLLYLIPFLPLTSLIAARSVNTRWRSLALTAILHPARKTLLDIYLAAIVHPNFPSLVEVLQPLVHEFDREAYIANLTSRGCVLPDTLELWVLEWPSKAIHFWAWPGLPTDVDIDHEYYYWGCNMLGDATATLHTIPMPDKDAQHFGVETCRGLAIYQVLGTHDILRAQLWLVVDGDERVNDRHGAARVFWTYTYYQEDPRVIERPMKSLDEMTPFRAEDLIAFLCLLDLHHDHVGDRVYEMNWGPCIDAFG